MATSVVVATLYLFTYTKFYTILVRRSPADSLRASSYVSVTLAS